VLITRAWIACWTKKQIPSKNQGYTAFTSMWRGNGFIMGPRLFHALPCTQGGLVEHASVINLAELKMHAILVEGVCHSRKRAQQGSSTDDRNAIPSDYSSGSANGSPASVGRLSSAEGRLH
jgi:hypothetical protein